MAKLTKFTISPSGDLVYKSTGKLAPSDYKFRKNTVYGPNGRRIGTLSRKLTKKDAARIASAERSRKARVRRTVSKPRQGKPSRPSRKATQAYGEDWEQFDETKFPEPSETAIAEFAQRVRNAASSVAPEWLKQRIRAFSTEAIWKAYQEDAYIFEIYFKYHSEDESPHKSPVSVWLYQFVTRIEQYMGVTA